MNLFLSAYRLAHRIPGVRTVIDRYRDSRTLRQGHRQGTFAQHGEDRFVWEYFKKDNGTYIDIGASHPFRISNTYLLYERGWQGTTVEPIRELYEKHRNIRPRDTALNVAVGRTPSELTFFELTPSVLSTFDEASAQQAIAKGAILHEKRIVPLLTLSQIYQQTLAPRDVDFLSIDAEGLDYEILAGNDWSVFRPTLILFEQNEGESSSPSDQLLIGHGYRFLTMLGCNRVYEQTSAPAPNTPPSNHSS